MSQQPWAICLTAVGVGLAIAAGGTAVAADPLDAKAVREQAIAIFQAIPAVVPSVNENAITYEKVELGKRLFFDPRLSRSGFLSCNSCTTSAWARRQPRPRSVMAGRRGRATRRRF
jgi:cytochrome c peroxidase